MNGGSGVFFLKNIFITSFQRGIEAMAARPPRGAEVKRYAHLWSVWSSSAGTR